MVGGQPTIKDVCPKCNNDVLSKLDSYGLELYKRCFYRIADAGESVTFDYDYERLLRWILKLNFNSARRKQCRRFGTFAETPLVSWVNANGPYVLRFT